MNRSLYRSVVPLLIILVPIGLLFTSAPVLADREPNNSFVNAEPLTAGHATGSINQDDTDDYYSISLATGQTLKFTFEVGSLTTNPLYCYVYDKTMDQISVERILSGENYLFAHTVNSTTAGTWYIRISGTWEYGRYHNSYSLTLTLSNQNDADSGTDAADGLLNAEAVGFDTDLSGFLADDDRMDFYSISVRRDATYNFSFKAGSNGDASIYFTVYSSENIPMKLFKVSKGDSVGFDLPKKHITTGTYKLGVSLVSGSVDNANSYSFRIIETVQGGASNGLGNRLAEFLLSTLGIVLVLVIVYVVTGLILLRKILAARQLRAEGETTRALPVKALAIAIVVIVVFSLLGYLLPKYVTVGGSAKAEPYEMPLAENLPPTAIISLDATEIRVGENITVDASSSFDPDGSIQSIEWRFGDGGTSMNYTVSHKYNSANIYTLELVVHDSGGLIDTARMNVSVRANNTEVDRQSILLSVLEPVGLAATTINFDVQPNAMYCLVNVSVSGRGTAGGQSPPLVVNHSAVEVEFLGSSGEQLNQSLFEVSWTESQTEAYALYSFQSFGQYSLDLTCILGAVVCQVNIKVYY